MSPASVLRLAWLGLALAALLLGCERSPAPPEARFDWALVRACLDREPAQAQGALLARFPGSQAQEGSFARYQIMGSEVLDEVTFFQDLRSGRVNTVILKYRADLTEADRAEALRDFGAPGLRQALEAEPSAEALQGPLRLRALRQDRFGRLTLTVEPAPPPGNEREP